MKKIKILTLLCLILSIQACKKDNDKPINLNGIELNKGDKWIVIPSMKKYITSMEEEINNFNGNELNDYKILSKKLQENINLLTSNCTMSGKAHDELHKWLVPFIQKTNDFSKAKSTTEAEKIYNELKKSFEEFNYYFK
jgi:hypothetical protein